MLTILVNIAVFAALRNRAGRSAELIRNSSGFAWGGAADRVAKTAKAAKDVAVFGNVATHARQMCAWCGG